MKRPALFLATALLTCSRRHCRFRRGPHHRAATRPPFSSRRSDYRQRRHDHNFTNSDEFIHQIYVSDPSLQDVRPPPKKRPGEADTETFTQAGTFEVHCHIHPKMKLVVTVK